MESTSLRFTDILTSASGIANYLGEADVLPRHLLLAVDVLAGEVTMESIGRPLSPLVRRPAGGAHPDVRALAQRWFAELGNDPLAELDAEAISRFCAEVETLEATE